MWFEPAEIRVAAGLHKLGNGMIRRCRESRVVDGRTCGFGKYMSCRFASESRLSDAPRSGQQPGVVKRPPFPGRKELLDGNIIVPPVRTR